MQLIPDHGADANVYPITLHPRFELLTVVGLFTSACGITFYRGSLFVAELVRTRIWSIRIWFPPTREGTFAARRALSKCGVSGFGTDSWFRPANFYVGLDEALYVMDFYRLVIEHPEWMSTEAQKSKDLTKGIDRGRIYRIIPDGAPARRTVKLGSASNTELVHELENPGHSGGGGRRSVSLVDRNAVDVGAKSGYV